MKRREGGGRGGRMVSAKKTLKEMKKGRERAKEIGQ